jgi:lambda family phage tail tape measure protein
LKVAHFYPQESNDANMHHEGLLGKYSNKQAEIDQNYYKGIEIALSQIAEQFKPIDVAQQAITNAWGKIGNAVDEFVQTGKFKFSDFAKSVLRDLAAMIIKAQIFKAIQATLGMFGFSLPGLAAGGPGGRPGGRHRHRGVGAATRGGGQGTHPRGRPALPTQRL